VDPLYQGSASRGNRTRVRVLKNKVAPPFREGEVGIMYGKGSSREGDVLDLAAALEFVNKSGAWYSYGDVRLGQGREAAKEYLSQHPELADELEMKIRIAKGLIKAGAQEVADKSE